MLDFAQEIFAHLGDEVRPQVLETLEVLVRTYRNRHGSDRYTAYRPVPPDQVRQLACYSANLVALRLLLDRESYASGIPLAELLRVPGPSLAVLEEWKVTPLLWKAGLDTDGLRAMLTIIQIMDSPPRMFDTRADLNLMPSELALTQLIGDEVTEKRLRYGMSVLDERPYSEPASWTDMMKSWLIPLIAGIGRMPLLPTPPEGIPDEEISEVAELIFKYLRSSTYHETWYERVLQVLFQLPPVFNADGLALTAVALGHPELRAAIPELQNFAIYGCYAEIVRKGDSLANKENAVNWQEPSDETIAAVADVLRKPLRLVPQVALNLHEDELSPASPGLGWGPGAEGIFG